MATVKGSKQYQMVVVPYRPLYRVTIFLALLIAMASISWLTYQYGRNEGLALKIEVVEERDRISRQLSEANRQIDRLSHELAQLKVGGVIDEQANDEVRETIEALQEQIAEKNEEISFYKGVMMPHVADNKGLRIEQLDMTANAPDRIKYSLLLTQVVDKHEYVQGGVRISLVGRENGEELSLPLSELDREKDDAVRFRFRYFQRINGELTLPAGFEPTEVMIVAQSSGANAQRLEKRFDWRVGGG